MTADPLVYLACVAPKPGLSFGAVVLQSKRLGVWHFHFFDPDAPTAAVMTRHAKRWLTNQQAPFA